MTHEEAFLLAIIENPEVDLPRLVYADWLTDRDDPRGEFIHVQCLLAPMSADDPRRPPLTARENELLARHHESWLGSLRPLLCRWSFRRGFLDEVAVPAAMYLAQGRISFPGTVHLVEVDLEGFDPPVDVIEFVPESVARENVLLPIGFRGRTLVLAMQDPRNAITREKLEFILNRSIEAVAASTGQLVEAIDRNYGQSETESVDSILVDFANPTVTG